MTNRHIVKFNLKGKNARPETIGMGELGDLLKHFEAALKAEVPAGERVEHSADPDPLVSLVSIQEGRGSDMEMAVLDHGMPGLSTITEAISTGLYSKMDIRSHKEFYHISKWVSRRKLSFEIEEDSRFNIRHAVISRKQPVPSPSASISTVDGVTTIWGYLVRTGGKRPRAALRFPDDSRVILSADEAVMKELGERLYENAGIEGVATWRIRDWKLTAFKAIRVLEYRPQRTDLVQSFKDLARASGGRWDDIDAEKFVRELRGETQP